MRAKINSLPFYHILLTYCQVGSCYLILTLRYSILKKGIYNNLTLQIYKFNFNFTTFIDLIKK